MSTLLVINFYKKIVLMQGLRNWQLDFKSFPTVYYMSDSDNQVRNDDRLKLLRFSNTKRRLGFHVVFGAADSALSLCFAARDFHPFNL